MVSLVLAVAGGFADAGSFVLVHSFTGHVTGNFLLMAIGAVAGDWDQSVGCVVAVAAFLCGTAAGAIWPHDAGSGPCRRLVVPLLAEMALIGSGAYAATVRTTIGADPFLALVCLALGIQNGILNKVGAESVHSTYITGMSTSLVSSLAMRQAGPKTRLLPVVILCFVAGAFGGAWATSQAGVLGFAGILVVLGVACLLAATGRAGT